MPHPYPSMLAAGGVPTPHMVAGASNYLAYSVKGDVWTKYASTFAGAAQVYGIAYDGHRRTIAITDSGLARSDDGGKTWTSYAFSVSGGVVGNIAFYQCAAIVYAFGAWFFIAPKSTTDVTAWRSTDQGLTWTAYGAVSGLGTISGLAYNGARLTVFGVLNGAFSFSTTTDGATWSYNTVSNDVGKAACSQAALNLWLARMGSATARQISCSTNGSTWTSALTIASGVFIDIAWSSRIGLFLVHADGGRFWTSPDAVTFTSHTATGLAADLEAIKWSGSFFLGVGTDNVIYTSLDGIAWTPRTTPATLNYAPLNDRVIL